jgi:hypothetical protein
VALVVAVWRLGVGGPCVPCLTKNTRGHSNIPLHVLLIACGAGSFVLFLDSNQPIAMVMPSLSTRAFAVTGMGAMTPLG